MGLEPTTPCLKGRCSNRLSYGPDFVYGYYDTEITPYIIRKIYKMSTSAYCNLNDVLIHDRVHYDENRDVESKEIIG